jgi:adenylate cyclase
MNPNKPIDVGKVSWFWFSSSAFHTDNQLRRLFRQLPHDPRCKFCNAPFEGIGGNLVRAFFGKQRSTLNPNFCNMCDEAARKFPGGLK